MLALCIHTAGVLQQEVSRLTLKLQALSEAKAAGESDAAAAVAEKAARLADAMDHLQSLETAAVEGKGAIADLELQVRCWCFFVLGFMPVVLCICLLFLCGCFFCEFFFVGL